MILVSLQIIKHNAELTCSDSKQISGCLRTEGSWGGIANREVRGVFAVFIEAVVSRTCT